jgi:hypothetical protein
MMAHQLPSPAAVALAAACIILYQYLLTSSCAVLRCVPCYAMFDFELRYAVFFRYTYMAPASLQPNWSAPLHLPSLWNLDVLLLGPGCPTPSHQHTQPPGSVSVQGSVQQHQLGSGDSVAAAVQAVTGAVSRGGRVLVPVIAGEGEAALQWYVWVSSGGLHDMYGSFQ